MFLWIISARISKLTIRKGYETSARSRSDRNICKYITVDNDKEDFTLKNGEHTYIINLSLGDTHRLV